jgi:hypothetical protein
MTTPGPQGSQREGGKGRPTPRRRVQEERNRRPVVAPPRKKVVIDGATKEERKAQRAELRRQEAEARGVARAGMMAGDERYLHDRDKGPVRRFVRDYVDARRNLVEYIMPVLLVSVVLTLVRIPELTLLSTVLLYGAVLVAALDVVWLRRKVLQAATAKFGAAQAAGIGGYAMRRAMQMRFSRIPKPQVQRGQYPS